MDMNVKETSSVSNSDLNEGSALIRQHRVHRTRGRPRLIGRLFARRVVQMSGLVGR